MTAPATRYGAAKCLPCVLTAQNSGGYTRPAIDRKASALIRHSPSMNTCPLERANQWCSAIKADEDAKAIAGKRRLDMSTKSGGGSGFGAGRQPMAPRLADASGFIAAH